MPRGRDDPARKAGTAHDGAAPGDHTPCMFEEQRAEPRERIALPLKLADGAHAVMRDISASGLYFVIEGAHVLSGPVDFELQLPELAMKFSASGEIVRVELQDGRTGVAVRLVNPRLDAMDEAGGPDGVAAASSGQGVCPGARPALSREIGRTKP